MDTSDSAPDTPPAELPLAQAQRRLAPRPRKAPLATLLPAARPPRRRKGPVMPPDVVVGLAAAGISKTRIAKALHVQPHAVDNVLSKTPGARERVAELREALKGIKLTRAHAVEGKLWDRLEQEVDGGAAKDVDGIARALLASEKIQAAAAGEAHASGAGAEPASAMDLTVLVQALLSAPQGA